ncbi:MAG: beta-lactamase family protein [Sphingomonadaceae bacterium]|nr:beta-lactamase family protein [Sphingomonadaceae bacterium]
MERLALPATLLTVALGVLIMAQFIAIPLSSGEARENLATALTPTESFVPEDEGADGLAGIEQLDARSGLVDYNALDWQIIGLMEDPQMVGLAVAVVENGETVFARGYGETLVDTGEPVTIDTVFRWASLSKGVAATMVAMLAGDGAIDMNAPLSRYVPSMRLPGAAQLQATVRDMLSHRLGIERHGHDMRLERDEDPYVLRGALAGYPYACPPGTCHRYQNVGFDGASELVEGVTGQSYEAATRERLLAPLGMTSVTMSRRGLWESASWARSHNRSREEVPVVLPYYRIPAAGGVNGSIRDMARWIEAQLGEAPDVLPRAILATVQTPVVRTEREDRRNRRYAGRIGNTYYALGWRVYDYAGHRVIAHRGAVRGYRAMIMFDPVRRSGVAILSNSDSGRPFTIPMAVFDQLYGLPEADWIEGSGAPGGAATPGPAIPGGPPMIEGRRRPGDIHSSESGR